jgi:hypothetical protein
VTRATDPGRHGAALIALMAGHLTIGLESLGTPSLSVRGQRLQVPLLLLSLRD